MKILMDKSVYVKGTDAIYGIQLVEWPPILDGIRLRHRWNVGGQPFDTIEAALEYFDSFLSYEEEDWYNALPKS